MCWVFNFFFFFIVLHYIQTLTKEHKERAYEIEELEKQLQKLRMSAVGGLQESEKITKKARSE